MVCCENSLLILLFFRKKSCHVLLLIFLFFGKITLSCCCLIMYNIFYVAYNRKETWRLQSVHLWLVQKQRQNIRELAPMWTRERMILFSFLFKVVWYCIFGYVPDLELFAFPWISYLPKLFFLGNYVKYTWKLILRFPAKMCCITQTVTLVLDHMPFCKQQIRHFALYMEGR